MIRTVLAATLVAVPALAQEGWVTHALALSPDLGTVVRGSMHAELGTARLYIQNAATGGVLRELKASGPIRDFAFRPDGARFAATSDHGPLRIVETATGKVVGELVGHRSWVHAIAIAGPHVASTGRDDTLRVWSADRFVELWKKDGMRVGSLALSSDGKRLATTDAFGKVFLWDAATGRQVREFDIGESRWSFVVAFSPDGKRVAAGSARVRVFDLETGKVLATVEGHKKYATALAFSPDGTRLATADSERHVRLCRVADGAVERRFATRTYPGAARFSADGGTLAVATYHGKCRFWNAATGDEIVPKTATKPKR